MQRSVAGCQLLLNRGEVVKIQIVEHEGSQLFETLKDAMRSGGLRTFELFKRGRKIKHRAEGYHGWINWEYKMGVITCEVLSPQKPGHEWKLLSSFVGRLADRYADKVHSISIQFDQAPRGTSKKAGR